MYIYWLTCCELACCGVGWTPCNPILTLWRCATKETSTSRSLWTPAFLKRAYRIFNHNHTGLFHSPFCCWRRPRCWVCLLQTQTDAYVHQWPAQASLPQGYANGSPDALGAAVRHFGDPLHRISWTPCFQPWGLLYVWVEPTRHGVDWRVSHRFRLSFSCCVCIYVLWPTLASEMKGKMAYVLRLIKCVFLNRFCLCVSQTAKRIFRAPSKHQHLEL